MRDDESWYYEILGKVVKQAIVDYSKGPGNKFYRDAKNFLMTRRLCDFLEHWRIIDNVNIRMIRDLAKNRKEDIDERKNRDNEL